MGLDVARRIIRRYQQASERPVSDRGTPDCSERYLGGSLMAGIMSAESVLIRARDWHEFGKAVLAEPRQPRKHAYLFKK